MDPSIIQMPAISIFMPVYNGSQYLEETITSFLNQSFSNFELICIDDSSTDDSFKILQKFASKDFRLLLLQKPNGGTVSKSLNFALPFSRGEYFFYTSQDDLVSRDILENMYTRAKETDADGVLPDMVWYYEDGNDTRGIFFKSKDKIISGREAASRSIDYITIHGFSLRKMSLVKEIKFYDFGLYSDEYTMRIVFLKSKTIAFCEGTFYYRQNNPNAITKKLKLSSFDRLETNEKLRALFLEYNVDDEENERLVNMSFNDLVHYQYLLIDNTTLSKTDRRLVQSKIKQAYKNFKEIKSAVTSRKFYLMFTNGYYPFVFNMRALMIMRSLIPLKNNLKDKIRAIVSKAKRIGYIFTN